MFKSSARVILKSQNRMLTNKSRFRNNMSIKFVAAIKNPLDLVICRRS
jgi:hypothetical protein